MKENEIKKLENKGDFKKVYQVFSGEPYNEKYTDEELEEIYEEYQTKGFMYGAYLTSGCVGLIAVTNGVEDGQPVSFPGKNVAYLSDIAVLDSYRNSGVGTQLMLYSVMAARQQGYDTMYMRTLEKGKSMSYGIANEVGFKQIPNISQPVERERTDGSIQKMNNIFLELDLRNLDKNKLKNLIRESSTKLGIEKEKRTFPVDVGGRR